MKDLDLYQFDHQLNAEQLKVRDQVREFVDHRVLPQVGDLYEKAEFDSTWIKELARLRLFGPTIKGYGCPGYDHVTYGIMMRELERGDSGLRSFVSVQGALAMYAIYKFGSDSLKNKYLESMSQGETIGCFGLTEPLFGSNPAGMLTKAEKTKGGYVLSGNKKWLSNGTLAKVAIIWAKDSSDQKIKGFVVDTASQGIVFNTIENKWSLRVSPSAECTLDNLFVPDDHVLGISGLRGPFTCLNLARFGIGWGTLGAMRGCLEEVLQYSTERHQFLRPLSSHQLVQAKLVTILTELTKGQALAYQVARLLDGGAIGAEQVSMLKMNNVSEALKAARAARDILGANGITYKFHTGRHMLNLETVNTYEGTEDIHRLILGQWLTGESAFA